VKLGYASICKIDNLASDDVEPISRLSNGFIKKFAEVLAVKQPGDESVSGLTETSR